MTAEVSFKIARGVFFDTVGNEVYLRNVDTHRDYLFNESSAGILALLTDGACSLRDVMTALAKTYSIEITQQLQEGISAFLEQLCAEHLLERSDTEPENNTLIYDHIQEVCIREHRLMSLAIELTNRCNESCIHCYVDSMESDEQEELTLEEYKWVLLEAKKMGCISVLLTGGEVTLKSCFADVAEYAASLGLLVDIYSNGLHISEDVFDRITAIKPNSISYSLYGGTARVHDSITGVPGSFERTLKQIMLTKCAGVDTFIKTVVMKENAADMENLLKISKRMHVALSAAYTILDNRSGSSAQQHRLSTQQEYVKVMELFETYGMQQNRVTMRDIRDRACNAGQCSLSIDPKGNVYPCLSIRTSLGNVRETSLRSIWETSADLQKVRRIRHCDLCKKSESCDVSSFCDICMGRVDPDRLNVPTDTCMLAYAQYHCMKK